MYVNPNPLSTDEMEAPANADAKAKRGALEGWTITVEEHKPSGASSRFKLLIFLNKADFLWGRLYEQIRVKTFPYEDLSAAFLVNSFGGQLVGSHRSMDMTPWDDVMGTVNSTPYIFRDMFVNHLFCHEDEAVRESQKFAACHGDAVTERNYVSEIVRESKILTGLLAYREAVEGLEDHNSFLTTDTVDEREYEAGKKMKDERKRNMLESQKRKDEAEQISKKKITNQATKASFLQAMVLERKLDAPVSAEGHLVDVFLRSSIERRETGRRAVCRMIDILPQDWPCIQYLKKHLFDYMRIMEVKADGVKWEQKVEGDWSQCLLKQLKNTALGGSQNVRVMHILASLALQLAEEGDEDPFKYCLKSSKLTKQVSSHMRTWEDDKQLEADNLQEMVDSLKSANRNIETPSTSSPNSDSDLQEARDEIFPPEEKEIEADIAEFEVLHDQAEESTYSSYNIIEVGGIENQRLVVPPGTPIKRTPVKKRRFREEKRKGTEGRYKNLAAPMTPHEKCNLLRQCIEMMEDPAGPLHSHIKDQFYLVWEKFYNLPKNKGGRSFRGLQGSYFGLGKYKTGVQQAIFDGLKVKSDSHPSGKTVRDNKNVIIEFYKKKLCLGK